MESDELIKVLGACSLFIGVKSDALRKMIARGSVLVRTYDKDEVIAFEEDPCSAVGVVAEGSINIQRIYSSGKSITLETVRSGDSFGEALLFSNPGVYPATLIASEDSEVIFVSREAVLGLMNVSPQFLESFVRSLSNRILLLNRRIKGLSLGSVRQKVANYILEEYAKQRTKEITLAWSREEMAGALGIPRPSLSRELIAMREEGWITFERNRILILDVGQLENCLGA